MLLYGTVEVLSIVDVDKTSIFSITSMNESLPVLHLVPPRELGYLTDYEFDLAYYNYILGNPYAFGEFFVIINQLYIGRDVLLVFSNDDWSENLAESLLKIIQQRYGYNGVLITCLDDYIFASNNMDFNFNREWGLINLDNDKNQISYIMEQNRLQNGGIPYREDGEGL